MEPLAQKLSTAVYEKINSKTVKYSTPVEINIDEIKVRLGKLQDDKVAITANLMEKIDTIDKEILEIESIIQGSKDIGVE